MTLTNKRFLLNAFEVYFPVIPLETPAGVTAIAHCRLQKTKLMNGILNLWLPSVSQSILCLQFSLSQYMMKHSLRLLSTPTATAGFNCREEALTNETRTVRIKKVGSCSRHVWSPLICRHSELQYPEEQRIDSVQTITLHFLFFRVLINFFSKK
jgi:hypothetical protein